MIDFTKDELKLIKLALLTYYDFDGLLDTKNLAGRVQSIIDNYCEHKQYTPIIGAIDAYLCDSCNEIIIEGH